MTVRYARNICNLEWDVTFAEKEDFRRFHSFLSVAILSLLALGIFSICWRGTVRRPLVVLRSWCSAWWQGLRWRLSFPIAWLAHTLTPGGIGFIGVWQHQWGRDSQLLSTPIKRLSEHGVMPAWRFPRVTGS